MRHCRKCKLELDGGDHYCHACEINNGVPDPRKTRPVSMEPSFTQRDLDRAGGLTKLSIFQRGQK